MSKGKRKQSPLEQREKEAQVTIGEGKAFTETQEQGLQCALRQWGTARLCLSHLHHLRGRSRTWDSISLAGRKSDAVAAAFSVPACTNNLMSSVGRETETGFCRHRPQDKFPPTMNLDTISEINFRSLITPYVFLLLFYSGGLLPSINSN